MKRCLWMIGAVMAIALLAAQTHVLAATVSGTTIGGGVVLAISETGATAAVVTADDSGLYTLTLKPGSYTIIPDSQDATPAKVTLASDDEEITVDFTGKPLPVLDLAPDQLPPGSVWRSLLGGSPTDFGPDGFPTNNAGSAWYFGPADPLYKEEGDWKDAEMPANMGLDQLGNGGQAGNGGYFWYRLKITVPAEWKNLNKPIVLDRYGVEDNDWAFVNGFPVGFSTTYQGPGAPRRYQVPNDVIVFGGENVIAIKGNHGRGGSGMENANNLPRLRVANQPAGVVIVYLRDKTLASQGPPPIDFVPAMNTPVTLLNSSGKEVATVLVDQAGYAWFQDLPPGKYTVKIDDSKALAKATPSTVDVNVEPLKAVVVEPQIVLHDVAPGGPDPRDDSFSGNKLNPKWTTVVWGDAGGGVTVSNGVLTITGGGEFAGTNDVGWFVYQKVSGDFVASIKVLSSEFPASGGNGRARASLMVRADDSDSAPYALIHVAPYRRGVFFQWRSEAGGDTSAGGPGEAYYETGIGAPVWVVLRRIGNNVAGFVSMDGKKASMIWQTDLPNLPKDVLVGPAWASQGEVASATFTDFKLRAPTVAVKFGIPDATIALQIAVGKMQPTSEQLSRFDLNKNGRVDIPDVTRILRLAVGLDKM